MLLSEKAAPAARFFMYDEPALNHRWLRHCARYKELRLASKAENTAEVGLYKALARHPSRTLAPSEARLFYIPVFEYTSKYVDATCANASATPPALASHRARMSAAHDALKASPHWRAHGGRDHIWSTTCVRSNTLSPFSPSLYALHPSHTC
jgi:hypothetical protein